MHRVEVAHLALFDLMAHAAFIAQDSESAAAHLEESFEKLCATLREFPEIGRRSEFGSRELRGSRRTCVPGFPSRIVFYRVSARRVLVLRVLHAARNLDDLLG